jgi:hypothetical protein
MTNWKVKLSLLCLGLLLPLFIGEGFFRIKGFAASVYRVDPNTGLVILNPNSDFYWIKDCYKNEVVTNSQGFHEREYAKDKPNDVYRIAVIGDSQVESLQVPLADTAYKVLEQELSKNKLVDKKIEVIAFGHSGNGQLLDYLYLKKYVLDYKPDLVIDLFLVANDLRDDNKSLANIYNQQTGDSTVLGKPYPILKDDQTIDYSQAEEYLSSSIQKKKSKQLADTVIRHSALLSWLYQTYRAVKTGTIQKQEAPNPGDTSNSALEKMPVDMQVILKDYSPEWIDAWKMEERIIRDINESVINAGSKFLLISSADGFRVHADQLSWQKDFPDKN